MTPSTIAPPALPAPAPVLSACASSNELLRRENLKLEGQIRTLGRCFAVGGIMILVLPLGAAIFGLIGGLGKGAEGMADAFAKASVNLIFALVPAAVLVCGLGLNKVKPTSGISCFLACLVSIFALFPVGLALSVSGFILLLGKRGRQILSPEYAPVMSATPHIQSRASWVIPAFVGLVGMFYFLYAMVMVSKIADAAASRM